MEQQIITIIGGTGFLGRYVVRQLARAGYTIRVIARNPEAALSLRTAGDVGQIVLVGGNLCNPQSLVGKIEDSYAVINLVGILFESGSQAFTRLHAQGAEKLAKMAKDAGVKRFIHVSALGVDKATTSQYARSKAIGENAVLAAFPAATILRPGVIFGPEDNFFNLFARMASLSPVLPLIGGGRSKMQPVYVGDVAAAIEVCLGNERTEGKLFELGGPRTYSMADILNFITTTIRKSPRMLKLSYGLASLIGAVAEFMPRPLLTRDQVKLLKYDNVVTPGALGFTELGIQPQAIEDIVPAYLARYHYQPEIAA